MPSPQSQEKENGVEKDKGPQETSTKGQGLFTKKKVVFEKKFGDMLLRELDGINCKGALLIPGFPSVTLTPILTAGFLVEELGLPLLAFLTSSKLPPKCVIERSQPCYPIRILGDSRVVIVQSETKLPPELVPDVVQAILFFSRRHSVKMVVCIEGVPSNDHALQAGAAPKPLQFLTSNQEFSHKLEELGHTGVKEGVIAGITGALLAEGALLHDSGDVEDASTGVEVSCLLAPSSLYPDAKSTLHVLQALKQVIPELSSLATTALEAKAKTLDSSVQSLLEQEQLSSAHHMMYQ